MSWRVHGYPDDYWRMTISALGVIFPQIEWLDRFYLVNAKKRDKVPVHVDAKGRHWIERTETVGFGRKK
jgi:hypothetical protein